MLIGSLKNALLIVPLFLFLTGFFSCVSRYDQSALHDAKEDSIIATEESKLFQEWNTGRDSFYDENKLYWLSIENWQKTPEHGWRDDWNRLFSGIIPKKTTSVESTLKIFEADSNWNPEKTGQKKCPTLAGTPLYSTRQFNISAMGNKTKGRVKGNYLIQATAPDERLFGVEFFHLVAQVNDPTMVREGLSFNMLKLAKLPVARWTHANLCINGDYYGVYFIHERQDAAFYQKFFKTSKVGYMYEGLFDRVENPLIGNLEFKGNEPSDYADKGYSLLGPDKGNAFVDLVKLVQKLNFPPDEIGFESKAYRKQLEDILDVDATLRWAAVNKLLGAWDNYLVNPANYFLLNVGRPSEIEPEKKALNPFFHIQPVDYDNTWGTLTSRMEKLGYNPAQDSIFNWNFSRYF